MASAAFDSRNQLHNAQALDLSRENGVLHVMFELADEQWFRQHDHEIRAEIAAELLELGVADTWFGYGYDRGVVFIMLDLDPRTAVAVDVELRTRRLPCFALRMRRAFSNAYCEAFE